MRLHGIHHISAITADARANLEFYSEVLGLRFVKKTVNFDDPTAYHLYYGDERGTPGSILTFFEYPGVERGRAGDGMIHRIVWRVADEEALDFWQGRLAVAGVPAKRGGSGLRFADPEGLELALAVGDRREAPLAAAAAGVPAAFALQGFDGVRAYSSQPERSLELLGDGLGFDAGATADGGWRVSGDERSSLYVYDRPPAATGMQGAGTVHHIAWAVHDDEQRAWRERVVEAGAFATPVIDRTYFRSVYFREPSGVLFEFATLGPGFTVDEPLEQLGRRLMLPPRYEELRSRLEATLRPLEPLRREAA